MGRSISREEEEEASSTRKHGNCISIKKRRENEEKTAAQKDSVVAFGVARALARVSWNITQKLIILHYDYVVYSLTMRLSNWCQRSQSTQRKAKGARQSERKKNKEAKV
jgi:hypothetical protein